MSRVGISRDNFTGRPCFLRNLANQLSPYKALAIILEDNCIGFLDSVADRSDYFRDLLGRWADNFFAIVTNHLLMECVDAGFDHRAQGFILAGFGCSTILPSS